MDNTRTLTLMLAALLLAPTWRAGTGRENGVLRAQDTTATKGKKGEKAKGKAGREGDTATTTSRTPKQDQRAKLLKDSVAAEHRVLFARREPLPFTLIANFGAISRNRDSTSKVRYAGTLVVSDSAGAERRIPVQLRTRGHFRLKRNICRFVNLLVQFPGKDKALDGTPFDGQKSLKLGAHCQDNRNYDQLLRREYLAYRVFNTFSPRSFRARLALGTYVDSASGKTLETRTAMWIESEDEMAARLGGHLRELRRALFDDMEAATLDQMAIFQYAIGNTDWSIYALHNMRLVVTDSAGVFPIPYDFDFAGLVNAPYASPAPQLQIRSVRERLFRGPCRTWEQIAPSISRFVARRDEVLKLVDEVPGLERDDARDVRDYLQGFFDESADARQARQIFIEGCLNKPGA